MRILVNLASAVFGLIITHNVLAQTYPDKPVRIIVPFPAGGITDFQLRWAAQKLNQSWGQPVVVDNRPGAGGTLGTDMVARAPKDGYTLLGGNPGPLTIAPSTYARLPYDPHRDLQPITLIAGWSSCVCAHPGVPFRTVREMVALAKTRPGVINYGTPGVGTVGHLATELLASMAKVKLTHIPYKGAPQINSDLVAGYLDIAWVSVPGATPLVRQGKMRALGVTSLTRVPQLPDVPTVDEQGIKGFESSNWNGLLGPAGMSRDIVNRIHAQLARDLDAPDASKYFTEPGYFVYGKGPDEFAQFIKAETEKWAKVVRDRGITLQ
ncbi:MAG: hypothetical protein A3H34_02830 [Betaproteobacteria bacterium RIFCSPLOWO2_02_FULL_67_19]|nr:MAG: hypothetical protein A3H34_02830 [Betaproteobacteria bacterium RIFCSPLOWO2_02_FULL_67_19]